jgi:hypothetical protein
MLIDFMLFITHKFLVITKNIDSKNFARRSINTVSWMICNVFLTSFFSSYMFLISKQIVNYNKFVVFLAISLSFILVNVLLSRRYRKEKYDLVILEMEKKYIYGKLKTCVLFCIFLFVPLFSLGIGVLFLRNFLYK